MHSLVRYVAYEDPYFTPLLRAPGSSPYSPPTTNRNFSFWQHNSRPSQSSFFSSLSLSLPFSFSPLSLFNFQHRAEFRGISPPRKSLVPEIATKILLIHGTNEGSSLILLEKFRKERGKRINRSSPMFNYRVLICIGTNTGGGVRSRKSLFESFRFHAFSFLSFLLAFVLATIIFYRAPTADRSVSSSVNATILQPLYNDRVYTGEECVCICVCMCACVRRVRFDVALKAFLFFLWRVTMAHTSGRIARVLGRSARAWFTMDRDGTSNWTAF